MTLKVVVTALIVVIGLLAPRFLGAIYPNSEYIQFITEGKGWYIYIGLFMLVGGLMEYKILKNKVA